MNIENPAYHELYLESNISLHRLLFVDFLELPYDTFSLIDAYMQTSEIRTKMDIGNWSALNKGDKQLLNSIDYSVCTEKNGEVDTILLHWLADIYVLFQWMYNIPLKEINKRIPANELAKKYYPLHETSEKNACEKLYHIYFERK